VLIWRKALKHRCDDSCGDIHPNHKRGGPYATPSTPNTALYDGLQQCTDCGCLLWCQFMDTTRCLCPNVYRDENNQFNTHHCQCPPNCNPFFNVYKIWSSDKDRPSGYYNDLSHHQSNDYHSINYSMSRPVHVQTTR
jgi:hypothetical protein